MPDQLVKLNVRISGSLPAWCPACGNRSIEYHAQTVSIENEKAVGWSWKEGVRCTFTCGVVGKLITVESDPMVFAYDLYAPKHLIPKLVARKLRGELDGSETYRGLYVRGQTLTEFHDPESPPGDRFKFDASLIDVPFSLPPRT